MLNSRDLYLEERFPIIRDIAEVFVSHGYERPEIRISVSIEPQEWLSDRLARGDGFLNPVSRIRLRERLELTASALRAENS